MSNAATADLIKRPFKTLRSCKVCGSSALTDVIHIAPQFLSPTFVRSQAEEGDLAKIQVPFTLTLCDKAKDPNACGLLQLREEVEPDLLYHRYFYRSATSDMMRADLKQVIDDISSRVTLNDGDIVVDIGANDCTTLGFYPSRLRRVGIEPARNIDWSGVDKSITIINDYFSAKPFEAKFPGEKAKAIGSNAMFYDLADPNSFVADAKKMLAPDGVWCIQLSYLSLMLTNVNFYDICHEHLSYYSLAALRHLMRQHGLDVFDATTNHVNGGSLRAFITHTDNTTAFTDAGQRNLAALAKEEADLKLTRAQTFRDYFARIEDLAVRVNRFVDSEIAKGGKVFGLGASTKGNVLLQFFGIDKNKMPFISERNPDKVGLRTLGTDFELISEERARELKPSSMIVLPWYFKTEIVARERPYLESGGKLIFPMPHAHVVTKDGEIAL